MTVVAVPRVVPAVKHARVVVGHVATSKTGTAGVGILPTGVDAETVPDTAGVSAVTIVVAGDATAMVDSGATLSAGVRIAVAKEPPAHIVPTSGRNG